MFKRSYLTVAQRKAVILLSEGMSHREIADKLNVSENAVRSWEKHNEIFKTDLNKRVEEITGIDIDYRRFRNQSMLYSLYREFTQRQADNSLSNFSNKDLVKSIALLQNELRIDTPGQATSRPETKRLDDMQERYKNSRSGKLFTETKKIIKTPRIGRIAVNASDSKKEATGD